MASTEGATVSRFLEHLGRRAVRHRWWFIGVWIVAAVAILVLAGSLDGQYSDNFRIPDTQSQSALDLLREGLPGRRGRQRARRVPDVRRHHQPVGRARDQASVVRARQDPQRHVGDEPVRPRGERVHLRRAARSRSSPCSSTPRPKTSRRTSSSRSKPPPPRRRRPASRSRTAARSTDYADQPPQGNADLIGLLAAVIILLFAFGSVVAMGLPILTAVFGLVVGSVDRQHRRRRSPRSDRWHRRSPR